jgi:uncharacterized protein YycO
VLVGCETDDSRQFKNGDIIFQTSQSSQSAAIQYATGSKFSHMGIIYFQNDQPYVYEAIQPVTLTSLDKWIRRGQKGQYIVKRLKNSEQILKPDVLAKMKRIGEKYRGKDYDLYFGWSDEKMYCSELIWKIYKEALNLEIGKLQKIKDFDLTHPLVKAKLKERYGNNIPLEEPAISPARMFKSDLLETVYSK